MVEVRVSTSSSWVSALTKPCVHVCIYKIWAYWQIKSFAIIKIHGAGQNKSFINSKEKTIVLIHFG